MRKRIALKEFFWITISAVLIALGVYFFKFPNRFSMGGVSGLSVILVGVFPFLKAGTLVFVINMILLAIGFIVFGKSFGIKTAYASTLYSLITWLLEFFCPMSAPFTDQPLLELVYAVMLPAVGSAILFNLEASSGGTDVIAMLLKKYTNLDIGKALLCSDFVITLAASVVFGIKIGLFSVLGLVTKALVVDTVIENINTNKYFTIITTNPDEICCYINKKLNRGATVQAAQGAFTHKPKTVIVTAVGRPQAVKLREFIKEADPNAFIMITNTSEIIGKGFRGA